MSMSAANGGVLADLARIGELIRTQDNRITEAPIFIVQQKRETVADADYDHDRIVWVDDDHGEAGEAEAAELEAGFIVSGDVPDGWRRCAMLTSWDFVTACFTEQGCKDYLARDGHNLREPRIYAAGSYRNEEWRAVRKFLASLPATPTGGGDLPERMDTEAAALIATKERTPESSDVSLLREGAATIRRLASTGSARAEVSNELAERVLTAYVGICIDEHHEEASANARANAMRRALAANLPAGSAPAPSADTKRLDWLSMNPRGADMVIDGKARPCVFWGVSAAPDWTVREAIDAAMAATPTPEPQA